jgi:hypothetical protein
MARVQGVTWAAVLGALEGDEEGRTGVALAVREAGGADAWGRSAAVRAAAVEALVRVEDRLEGHRGGAAATAGRVRAVRRRLECALYP